MRRPHRTSMLGAALAALPACAAPASAPPPAGGALVTDAAAYVARPLARTPGRYGFAVVARYTNRRAAPIRLAWCGLGARRPTYGIETVGPDPGGEGAAYNPNWGCVGHDDPIVVVPGATRVDTLALEGPNGWDGRTQRPFGALEGTFRLVYEAAAAPDSGAAVLPESRWQSNAFTVRLGR